MGVIFKLDFPPARRSEGAIYGLAFHEGGLRVASSKDQRTAEVWDATAEDDVGSTVRAGASALLCYMLYTAVVVVGAVLLVRAWKSAPREACPANAPDDVGTVVK
jgi:hypothetical protein